MRHLPRDIGEQIAFRPSGTARLMNLLLRLLGLSPRPVASRKAPLHANKDRA